MRPARNASFIASAMATGSCAPAIPVFISTPSRPSPHPGELADDPDVVRILNAEAEADRGAERHHGGGGFLEFPADHRVVVRVGQDHEALVDQRSRGVERGLGVWKQSLFVADHLELHPVREPGSPLSAIVNFNFGRLLRLGSLSQG